MYVHTHNILNLVVDFCLSLAATEMTLLSWKIKESHSIPQSRLCNLPPPPLLPAPGGQYGQPHLSVHRSDFTLSPAFILPPPLSTSFLQP